MAASCVASVAGHVATAVAPPSCAEDTQGAVAGGSILMEVAFETIATLLIFLFFAGRRFCSSRSGGLAWKADSKATKKGAEVDAVFPDFAQDPVLRGPAAARASADPERFSRALATASKKGRACELRQIFEEAKRQGVTLNAQHLMSSLRTCVKGQCFNEGLQAYDALSDLIEADTAEVWSILLFCAVEACDWLRCQKYFQQLLRKQLPSPNDFVNIVRCLVRSKDVKELRRVLAQLRKSGYRPDVFTRNRAIGSCVEVGACEMAQLLTDDAQAAGDELDVVGRNSLMKAYARAGDLERCFEILWRMRADGIEPSELTYGIALEACVSTKAIDRAVDVFNSLRRSNKSINAVHFTTMMKGLSATGRTAEAVALFKEMRTTGNPMPDLIAYSTLLKGLCDEGSLESAIELLEQMLTDKIRPDSIIFHHIFIGLHAHSSDPKLVLRVFSLMQAEGIMPSTSTLSIFLKCLANTPQAGEALDALETVRQPTSQKPEVRLYAQLAWGCIRSRYGSKVLEVYEAMARAAASRGEEIDEKTHDQLIRRCTQCGMLQTAAKIYEAARLNGRSVGQEVLPLLLETAAKKRKTHLIGSLQQV